MVWVATIDFDINTASYETNKNYGWYYYCFSGALFSGPPHNYNGKGTNLKSRNNEIRIIYEYEKENIKIYK